MRLVDQRRLPGALAFVDCRTVAEVVAAIRDLTVRGAPALGATGAFGVALAAAGGASEAEVAATRPRVARRAPDRGEPRVGRRRGAAPRGAAAARPRRSARAEAIAAADVATNRALGAHGAALLPPVACVLTHCNAGALACVGYGTALGVIRAAHEAGRVVTVWVDETRPVLQGARLTAWELDRLGIPYRVLVDAAAGSLFAAGRGRRRRGRRRPHRRQRRRRQQDRHLLRSPCSPTRTACRSTSPRRRRRRSRRPRRGADIPIELRARREVAGVPGGARSCPPARAVHNPAFDVTPARLVTALVTERGVLHPPDAPGIAALLATD